LYAKLRFGCVLKRSLSAHLMQVKLILVSLNGGLHAVSVGKASCQIFGRFVFLKTESEPNFSFPHIPNHYVAFCNQKSYY